MNLVEGQKLVDAFLDRYFSKKQRVKSRNNLLKRSVKRAHLNGLFLEFGVETGYSLNHLAKIKHNQKFYGFDCFTGLPEDWSEYYPKGHMKVDKIPLIRKNVELVIGLFQDTLEPFLEKLKEPVAFLHLDADLYSSTKYVLFTLADEGRLQPGTVIEFDEIFFQDSPNTLLDDEYRVFTEFIEAFDVDFRWLWFFQYRSTTRASLIILRFGGSRDQRLEYVKKHKRKRKGKARKSIQIPGYWRNRK